MSKNLPLPVPVMLSNGMPPLDPIRTVLYAAMLRRDIFLRWFATPVQWSDLGNAETEDQLLSVGTDGNIVGCRLLMTSHSAAGTILPNPDYMLSIRVSGGDMLTDGPVHVGLITTENRNSGATVVDLSMPLLLKEGTDYTFTLQNLTAVAARVDLAVEGYKIRFLNPRVNMTTLFGLTA